MFQQPSAGSDFRAKDHVGHLLLIYVRELREGIVTQYGTSDAISADLVVLTDPAGPRAETQVLFFQKPLIGSLRNSIGGDPVLARLGQGTAKPGQSAPYILNPFTEQDAAFATQYLASVGGNPFVKDPNEALYQRIDQAAQQAAPMAPLPTAVPQVAPAAYPPAYPAPAPATGPIAAMPQQFAANGAALAAQVPPAQPAPAAQPVPAAGAAPGQLTPEQAAALQALGMQGLPPAAPQG